MRKKTGNTGISRRDMLKGMAAVAAVAGASGCSTSNDDDYKVLSPQEELTYDRQMQTCFSSGPYNCGAKCLHKIHYKNGKLYHLTSAGDIPREGSHEKDNSPGTFENPIQRRACVRGYGYLQRLYQPDRLKYPLMRADKSLPRGRLDNFKRVSWEEAIDAAADAIYAAAQKRRSLGYTPIFCRWTGQLPLMAHPDVAPCIYTTGNESTGAADGAKYDMVGLDSFTNNVSDRLNSGFIITWGLDPSRTTYYVEHAHWFNTVCKEKQKEMVVITPNYSDAAGMLTTGIRSFTYTRYNNTSVTTSPIGGWIPARPSTDAALAAAMAYVILINKLYAEEYVHMETTPANDRERKSFGFRPGDEMCSIAPKDESETTLGMFLSSANRVTPEDFQDESGKMFRKGEGYQGAHFKVPPGESFVEYLRSLECSWAGAPGNPVGPVILPDVDQDPDFEVYWRVLEYAANLTGVPAATIEALAFKYATAGSGFLDVGGGPQRAWNGVEWVQMMIALCTMTGNIDRPGGGAGYAMMSHADHAINKPFPVIAPGGMLPDIENYNGIFVPMSEWSHVALTGKDYRSKERFINDIKNSASRVDLSGVPDGEKLLKMDVWFMRSYNGLHTLENVNKIKAAADAIETIICIDQTMHPTAAYSDIIFPACSHYETEGITTPTGSSAYFKLDAPLTKTMYDTKTDAEITALLNEALNKRGNYGLPTDSTPTPAALTYMGLVAKSSIYEKFVDTENKVQLPTYEEFSRTGTVDFPVPEGKSVPGMKHFSAIGQLVNTTGVVNFWQPLWGHIRKKEDKGYRNPYGIKWDGFRNPTAAYQPNVEGYEEFFDNGDPLTGNFTGYKSPRSGRIYKLFYMTNKARNRAHTVFDNVAMIKDQFKQQVYINPVDAAARGIKDGDMVYVYNERGCTYIPACVTYYIVPGVISVEHGAWYRPHPTEKVKVWLDLELDENDTPVFKEYSVPVDIGGCENVLTLGVGSAEHYCGQAVSAQGGPCEVSLTKPV